MYVTPEQIQSANKANVETLLAVANTQFAAFEKLANISAGAVKSAFEDSINNTRALLGAKDVQEFVTLHNLLDKVSKNAPAGSDVAVAAIKSMLAASNSAYDNLTKVARQATEIAEANVSAATETVRGMAKAKKAA
jgi:hypothetical protein